MATLTLCTDCSQLASIREFVAQHGRVGRPLDRLGAIQAIRDERFER